MNLPGSQSVAFCCCSCLGLSCWSLGHSTDFEAFTTRSSGCRCRRAPDVPSKVRIHAQLALPQGSSEQLILQERYARGERFWNQGATTLLLLLISTVLGWNSPQKEADHRRPCTDRAAAWQAIGGATNWLVGQLYSPTEVRSDWGTLV